MPTRRQYSEMGIAPYKSIWINKKVVLEHRHKIEQHLGRKLLLSEHVHHKNKDTRDNRISNLMVMDGHKHLLFEGQQRYIKRLKRKCPTCKKDIFILPKYFIWEIQKRGTRKFFCSKRCKGKFYVPKGTTFGGQVLDIDNIIRKELKAGLTGYAIAKKHKLDKGSVYNHIHAMSSKLNG